MESNKIIESLKKDISDIAYEVYDLVWVNKIYNGFINNIIDKKIERPNDFIDYVRWTYVSHMAMGICKEIDSDDKSVSLINILNKIFLNANVITKEWFSKKYKSPLSKKHGENDFQNNFGTLDFIDPSIVYADAGRLLFYTKKIKKFRNKIIAHRDKKNKKLHIEVAFSELDDVLNLIKKLTLKYFLLLHQASYDMEPVIDDGYRNYHRSNK